jgi:hypothetical protein
MTDRIYTSTTDIERARALWEKGILLAETQRWFLHPEAVSAARYIR